MSQSQGYVKKQSNAIKKSIHIPIKIFFLECAKYLVLFILFLLLFAVFLILVRQASPVIDILTQMKIGGVSELAARSFAEQKSLFTGFIVKAVILALITFISAIAILTFFDYTILRLLRKQKWDTRLFLKLLRCYALIHAILLAVIILLVIVIANPYVLATLVILCIVIYAYLMLHAQAFFEGFFEGFKKAHYILIPFIILFILGFIILIIHSLLVPLLKEYILIPLFLSMVILIVWVKSYVVKLTYR
ncbi:MAG: hypothetical protein WC916_02065 [Candidatus Woesearchaeota archaeon]